MLFASLCLVLYPSPPKRKKICLKISKIWDPTSLTNSLRKSSLPHIDLFLELVTSSFSCSDETQACKEHSRNSWSNTIFQVWDWTRRVCRENSLFLPLSFCACVSILCLCLSPLPAFLHFFVKRNRLHSWILYHVINKAKYTAFFLRHMALFLKHRSGPCGI